MANCPVEGSDIFLHLSCVIDDMISIMQARFSPFGDGRNAGSWFTRKNERRKEAREKEESRKVKGL
jgi:hypothetical protein